MAIPNPCEESALLEKYGLPVTCAYASAAGLDRVGLGYAGYR